MIKRDGAKVSLWQNVQAYQHADTNAADQYDVAVIGGGITGVTTALLLQQAGKRCILLEANTLCFGTTGGTTAHLNTLLDVPYSTLIKNFGDDNAKLVAEATSEAIRFVKSNIDKYTIDCGFEEASAYLFAQDDDQNKELDEIYKACVKVGLDVSYINSIEVSIPFIKAIRVNGQAKFHPVKYVQALAKIFEQAGGVIRENCRVTDHSRDDERITLTTENGMDVYASSVVYATHIPPGINLLHLRCSPYRSYVLAVELADNSYPENLIYDMYDPYHYYRTQVVDGIPYLIAGGEDHKTGQEDNTGLHFLHLESYVRTHFNVKQVAYKWSSQYFEPADGLPYIGHLPGNDEHVYVATGYGGNGMVYSTIASHIIADTILNRGNRYKDLFTPSRVKIVAGFSEFVSHNVDVVKQFVGKWFSVEELEELAALAPGEGKVVTFDDHLMALSKDAHGQLHAVSPVCTHMKCSVAWNGSENSWDCPCHGARYSPNGKVLTGPATKNLTPIDIRQMEEKI